MSKLLSMLSILLDESLEDLPRIRENADNKENDYNGRLSNTLAGSLERIAIFHYGVHSDARIFRQLLRESSAVKFDIVKRFDAGEPISKSFVSMLLYQTLFNSLASGDIALANSIAKVVGGRVDIENEFDHPFDRALGYALKETVLGSSDAVDRIRLLKKEVSKPSNKNFSGYAAALEAIYNKDVDALETQLSSIISGHIKLCSGQGIFKGTKHEVLCIWGIGLVVFARSIGMPIHFDVPLLPEALIL
ncbi:hypothetical protein MACH09_38980 [Vibrio sp. MACH09]|uniref:hypothetical protein n=1 Tax=Vibrio sp. MACH09 TaxID=3025122 RepID=UPI00278CFC25|nr:hypothetical protein [Vibrio sp. MACH09]GLO63390.1 hypothetical protein MACH09_38980 [Vibrio sp. MACH09]